MWESCVSGAVAIFFFNDTATTEIYTLSLHDALPILGWTATWDLVAAPRWSYESTLRLEEGDDEWQVVGEPTVVHPELGEDRKSTRLNSSPANISYAVFCLKKKKTIHAKIQRAKGLAE